MRPRLTSAGCGSIRWSDAALGLSRLASGILVAATALLALTRLYRSSPTCAEDAGADRMCPCSVTSVSMSPT